MSKFIKILDEEIATELISGGFSYIEEKISGHTAWCFENTQEIEMAIKDIFNCVEKDNICLYENTLYF